MHPIEITPHESSSMPVPHTSRPGGRYHRPDRITNWSDYNAGLQQRGSLPVLQLRLTARGAWRSRRATGDRGRPEVFSDAWIAALLTLRIAFRLPWRQVTGLAETLVGRRAVVPHFGHLARRAQRLGAATQLLARHRAVALHAAIARGGGRPITVLIDSTGLSLTGPGPWRSDKPGADPGDARRRKYHKLHAAVDATTLEILSVALTDSHTGDPPVVPRLLDALPRAPAIATLAADGAYDTRGVYAAAAAHGITTVLVPPKTGARRWPTATPGAALRNGHFDHGDRTHTVVPGSPAWRRAVGYGVRSLVETTFGRLAAQGGNRLRARSATGQAAELWAQLQWLNTTVRLTRPTRVRRADSVGRHAA